MMAPSLPNVARLALGALVLAAGTSACTTSTQTRGYVLDEEQLENISAGVQRREVRDMLGNPSTRSAFGPEIWYYISRETVNQGFLQERPVKQKIVEIQFDDGGTVQNVKNYTLADAKRITPTEATTPVRGKTLGFFEQLLQGVGRVGPGGVGGGGPGGPRGPRRGPRGPRGPRR